MSIGGYLLFFRNFGSAEFLADASENKFSSPSARKSKAKKPFFPLHFTHLFVTLAPPNLLPLGKAKQKNHFFLCISLTYS